MDNQYMHNQPNVLTLEELNQRRDEFDVPNGAIEALKAGSAPVVVFLRGTNEEYELVDNDEIHPSRTTLGPTDRAPTTER
jgi:hypothetical protein